MRRAYDDSEVEESDCGGAGKVLLGAFKEVDGGRREDFEKRRVAMRERRERVGKKHEKRGKKKGRGGGEGEGEELRRMKQERDDIKDRIKMLETK